MRPPRHLLWFVATGCGIALVVVVVVLFFLPTAVPPPPVTIDSIDWEIQQQTPVNGSFEFAEQWINQSGAIWGFPFPIGAGGAFNDTLVIINDEFVPVPICAVSVSPPLYLISSNPSLPAVWPAAEDNALTLTLAVHADAGATVHATGVVSAVGCNDQNSTDVS